MNPIFKRLLKLKKESGLTWDEISTKAHIKQASWMTGIPTSTPSDEDIEKLAELFHSTFKWIKYGQQ